ncbi:Uncharacterized protein Rs2_03347 [Raphanus sativus]|nr:Uncharacterized protein Rs2_03347 [Raphanus sativus]
MTRRREVGLSRERHESDLKEKTRMFSESFVENMELFQNRVIRLREAEFERQKREKEEHVQVRKQERDVKKKQIYYLKCEERIRKRKKLASREWETIPYAAGVIVPLALTLLVRNAKKDKKRGVIVDVVGGDPCHTVRNHQFRDPVSSHWEDISTLPDLSSRSRARTTATGATSLWLLSLHLWERKLFVSDNVTVVTRSMRDQCGNGGERPGGDSWRSEEGRYAVRRSGAPRSSFSSRTSQRGIDRCHKVFVRKIRGEVEKVKESDVAGSRGAKDLMKKRKPSEGVRGLALSR